ncbi:MULTISPECIES: DUF2922 domain-containing protein [Psychrobacillus]|uniref:DUF2922 domain-containing protein n=1 Tax=Psychrobacillus lasiicapitis TaxID=1636719 RepID=A0A544TGY0_9BACI|nr:MULTISPECIES: DUF2922 domain-containing protein [Psychrobacillus]MDI2588855.1 DUF2922 domain-containing protein [Psychrobacillus sp. NEAU-3TGS]TQR16687.1 DUF2922 domain-containing protein [Psychrobacillus lasiicapitis]GGA28039.1 hypothetical protein GCM10011384_16770 [Psychrobacillus lasiicapitis]
MAKTLQLQFEAANGKNMMISVDEPKESLTSEEIQTGMDAIISSNVFQVEGSTLALAKSAKVVERNVTDII